MQIVDPDDKAPYTITQIIPSRGLATIIRDGDGLLLDFYEESTSTAVRIGVYETDAQQMLAELRKLIDLLSRVVAAPPSNSLN